MDTKDRYGAWLRQALAEFDKHALHARVDLEFYEKEISEGIKRGRLSARMVSLVNALLDVLPILPPLPHDIEGYMRSSASGFNMVYPKNMGDLISQKVCILAGTHLFPLTDGYVRIPPCGTFEEIKNCTLFQEGTCDDYRAVVNNMLDPTIDKRFDQYMEQILNTLDVGLPVQINGHLIGGFLNFFTSSDVTHRADIFKRVYRDYLRTETFESYVMNPVEVAKVRVRKNGPWKYHDFYWEEHEATSLPISTSMMPRRITNSKGVSLDIQVSQVADRDLVVDESVDVTVEKLKNDDFVSVLQVDDLAGSINVNDDKLAAFRLAFLINSHSYYSYFSFYSGIVGQMNNQILQTIYYFDAYNRKVVDSYRRPVDWPAFNLNHTDAIEEQINGFVWRKENPANDGRYFYSKRVLEDVATDRQLRQVYPHKPYYNDNGVFHYMDTNMKPHVILNEHLNNVLFMDTMLLNMMGIDKQSRMLLDQTVPVVELYADTKKVGYYNQYYDGAELIGLFNTGAVYYNGKHIIYLGNQGWIYVELNPDIPRGSGPPVWAKGLLIHGDLIAYVGHIFNSRRGKSNTVFYYKSEEVMTKSAPYTHAAMVEPIYYSENTKYINGVYEEPDVDSYWYLGFVQEDGTVKYGKVKLNVYQAFGLYFFSKATGKEIVAVSPAEVRNHNMSDYDIQVELSEDTDNRPFLNIKPPAGVVIDRKIVRGRYMLRMRDEVKGKPFYVTMLDVGQLEKVYQGFMLGAKSFDLDANVLAGVMYISENQ